MNQTDSAMMNAPTMNAPVFEGREREKKSLLKRIEWGASLPFIIFHVLAVVGVFLVPFSWSMVGLCIAFYYLRIFGVTAGYHRYFAHRTYKLNRFFQFCMAFLAQTSVQKGALWWAANHRHHHKFSDQPEDIHSPSLTGFWFSHVGWILVPDYCKTRYDLIPDFAKYPELVWLNKNHLIPPIAFGVMTFLIWGWAGLVWGFLVSTVLCWHGTFTINSLSHVFGSQRYKTTDTSRNNFWLAMITLGEGWHNNHHTYMSSTNQGFFWWEIDITYYTLKVMSFLGIAKDLRKPPLHLLEAKRISRV